MRKGILLLALMACSCGPARVVTGVQRDSVIIHLRDSVYLRDTVIEWQIPAESGANTLQSSDTSYLQTNLAESRAFIENGRLRHTLRNKSEAIIPIKVSIPERIRTEERGLTRYERIVETIEVEKELSRWQNFIMSLGYAVLIAGLAWMIWKLSRLVSFS
jgi:hypothetical protein